MARKPLKTLAYLALAYFLMLSYQIFTQSAVTAIATSLGSANPLGLLLSARVDLVVFVCSFAWNFVLSAIISQLVFGRERRLSIQFFISLGLTILSSLLIELFKGYGLDFSNPATMSLFSQIFGNPVFAFFYLALPFLLMVAIDLHLPKKLRRHF